MAVEERNASARPPEVKGVHQQQQHDVEYVVQDSPSTCLLHHFLRGEHDGRRGSVLVNTRKQSSWRALFHVMTSDLR